MKYFVLYSKLPLSSMIHFTFFFIYIIFFLTVISKASKYLLIVLKF